MKRILLGAVLLLMVNLLKAQEELLLGVSTSNGGSVFTMSLESKEVSTLVNFSFPEFPKAGLVRFGDKLYGSTVSGGDEDYGIIYSINPDGSDFEVLKLLTYEIGGEPDTRMTLYNDKLYGTATYGGTTDIASGLIFEFDPVTNELTTLHEFDYDTDGGYPSYSLTISEDVIYGVTSYGGADDYGVLYAFNLTTSEMTVLHEFVYDEGGSPGTGLILTNNKLYGATSTGGSEGQGVLYSYDLTTSTYEVIHHCLIETGASPERDMVLIGDYIYGITPYGGNQDSGTLFSYQLSTGNYTMLLSLDESTGMEPYTGINLYEDKLYGINSMGGTAGYGNIFSYDPADPDSYTILYQFTEEDRAIPKDNFLFQDGKMFLSAYEGGFAGKGEILTFDLQSATLSSLHTFGETGKYPATNVLEIAGMIYGTLSNYGPENNRQAALFSMDNKGADYQIIKVLKDENGVTIFPQGNMVYHEEKLFFIGIRRMEQSDVYSLISIDPDGSNMEFIRSSTGSERWVEVQLLGDRMYIPISNSFVLNSATGVFSVLPDGTDYILHVNNLTNGSSFLTRIGDRIYGSRVRYMLISDHGSLFSFSAYGTDLQEEKNFENEDINSPTNMTGYNGILYGMATNSSGKSTLFSYDPNDGNLQTLFALGSEDIRDLSGINTIVNGKLYGYGLYYDDSQENFIYSINLDGSDFTIESGLLIEPNNNSRFDPVLISRRYETNLEWSQEGEFTFGDAEFELMANSNSDAPMIFSSSDENVLTIEGNIATITGAGEVIITATQAQTEAYESAESAINLEIAKAKQEIKILKDLIFYEDAGTVDLTSYLEITSGLTPEITISDESVIGINFPQMQVNSFGNVELTINQAGNSNYLAAPSVLVNVNINEVLFDWKNDNWYYKDELTQSVPDVTDKVQLSAPFTFSSHGAFNANSLFIGESASLVVDGNQTLEVMSSLSNYGSLTVASGSSLITYEAGSFHGNALTIQRETSFADGRYSFVGTPVAYNENVTGSTLGSYVYRYDEAVTAETESTSRWITAGNEILHPGQGYTQANQLMIEFVGQPNVGDLIYEASYMNDGWHLVSNPYPAAIDLESFMITNPTTTGAIYLWDDNGSNKGRGSNSDYVVANMTGATDVSGADNAGKWNGYIGSMQGFFVKLDGEAADILFEEEMRVKNYNDDASFFRKSNASSAIARLNLTHADGLFKQTVIGWNENVSDDQLTFGYDAKVFDSSADYLVYSMKANSALAIQTVTSEKQIIAVGINVAEAGDYTLKLSENTGSQPLYIHDLKTGETVDAAIGYTFNTAAGQITDRFVLTTQRSILGAELTAASIYCAEKTLYIRTQSQEIKPYSMYSLSGQLIMQMLVLGQSTISVELIPAGVYVVTDGEFSEKIIIRD